MNIPTLVPRRADGGQRDELWRFVRDWWNDQCSELKIVEGHHDEGPFNRGAAINRAASDAGDWDVALIADADVVADPAQVRAAIEQARRTGRLTLAYQQYVGLNDQMTAQVFNGYNGDWSRGAKLKMPGHVSSLLAVPRALWDDVDGFDERFSGWGHDDVAFAAACRVLGGGVDRVPGTVWHLWHPHSPERDTKRPDYRASAALAKRYFSALTPTAMHAMLDERAADGVLLLVVTDGRRECIAETIPTAEKMLTGLPITRRVISDDSGDVEYQAWLRVQFPGWEVSCGRRRQGFGKAVHNAWELALVSGQRFVFWLEDDFTIEREVDLAAMASVLDDNPHLVQMALRRQAWFPAELEAGGVVEQHPDRYTDHHDERSSWLEHDLFWTTNPHLVSRGVLAAYQWPPRPHSEALFTRQVLHGGRRSGYWGTRDDAPWVTHAGQRSGSGY